jgi:hypothetical protein
MDRWVRPAEISFGLINILMHRRRGLSAAAAILWMDKLGRGSKASGIDTKALRPTALANEKKKMRVMGLARVGLWCGDGD